MQSSQRRHADATSPHQLFRLGRQCAFQISIVIDVVEALYQKIVSFIDVGVEPRARVSMHRRAVSLLSATYFSVKRSVGSLRSERSGADRSAVAVFSLVVV